MMRKQLLFISLVFIFAMIFSGAVSATDIYVNTTGSDTTGTGTITNPYQTIGMGISVVDAGGTVKIADGTYTGNNNRNIMVNKTMTIQGQSKTGTIINAQQANKIFIIPEDSYALVNIYNLTFINGKAEQLGGAIQNIGPETTLNIINCNFNNNQVYSTSHGGAIYNAGTTNVVNCSFTGNNAPDGYGGAIFHGGSMVLTIVNSTFTNNQALAETYGGYGGAIFNSDFTTNVLNCTFTSNQAGYGGAIYTGTTLNVVNSTFNGNSAITGGAIHNDGWMDVTRSIFTSNSATGSGGAIYTAGSTINYNVFLTNTAPTGSAIVGSGDVDATNNWWGSNANPSSRVSGVDYGPWILMQIFANPDSLSAGGTAIISADFTWNTLNGINPNTLAGGFIRDGLTVSFACDSLGSVSPATNTTLNGIATTNYHAGINPGYSTVNATLNSQKVSTIVTVTNPIDLKPTNLVVPPNPYTQHEYSVTVRVSNVGTADATGFHVILKDNGTTVDTEEITSLAAGDFRDLTFTWIPTLPGSHFLEIQVDPYSEVIEYNETNNAINTTSYVYTLTKLTVNPVSGYKTDDVNLVATLMDTAYNIPVSGKTINFYVNNIFAGTGITNSSGIATFLYDITLNPGIYSVYAEFLQDSLYMGCNNNSNLTVNHTPTQVTVSPASGYKTDKVNLIATLKDVPHKYSFEW